MAASWPGCPLFGAGATSDGHHENHGNVTWSAEAMLDCGSQPRAWKDFLMTSSSGDSHALQIRRDLDRSYRDVYTPEALAALAALAPLN